MLILRVGVSMIMIHHGYGKLTHFDEMQGKFMSFMGLSSSVSLGLLIFAEVACSALLILGLATRVALIPCIIAMGVAEFVAHGFDPWGKGEAAMLYLIVYVAIILVGPGRYSVDALIDKK